jgi:hypothetical protein
MNDMDPVQLQTMIDVRRRMYTALQGCKGAPVTAVATELVAKWIIAMPKEMREHCLDKHLQLLVRLLQIYDQSGDADPLGMLDRQFSEEQDNANTSH